MSYSLSWPASTQPSLPTASLLHHLVVAYPNTGIWDFPGAFKLHTILFNILISLRLSFFPSLSDLSSQPWAAEDPLACTIVYDLPGNLVNETLTLYHHQHIICKSLYRFIALWPTAAWSYSLWNRSPPIFALYKHFPLIEICDITEDSLQISP